MVESYQQVDSSDYWDWEKQEGLHSPNREPFFLPLEKLVLKEEKEILGLLNDVDSLKKQHVTEDSAYSCVNLDLMSSLQWVYLLPDGDTTFLLSPLLLRGHCVSKLPLVGVPQPALHSCRPPVQLRCSSDVWPCRPLPTHTQIPH